MKIILQLIFHFNITGLHNYCTIKSLNDKSKLLLFPLLKNDFFYVCEFSGGGETRNLLYLNFNANKRFKSLI